MPEELDRRAFLASLAGMGGSLFVGGGLINPTAITVAATPTVFFAQPDGRNAMIRFVVEGANAPAGRLRVFDRTQKQIGTAGVIGVGGRMYGELWIPLAREASVTSELELPGVRGVIRTSHRLTPRRRWTIYWLTAADLLTRYPDPDFLDHAEFLRLAERKLADRSVFALDADGLLDRVATAPMVLAGSGVKWIGVRNPPAPLSRVGSRDGSSVIAVTLAGIGNPNDLGVSSGRNEMTRRVEQWLDGPGAQLTDESHAIAMVVGSDSDSGNLEERIADWNSRYAYPRLVADRPGELLALIEKRATPAPTDRPAGAGTESTRWQASPADSQERALRIFAPLTSRLSTGSAGIAALAQQFAFRVPGTLVVNSGPFATTGIATMPDGSERLVTDVPALGYISVPAAVVPDGPRRDDAGRWVSVPGSDNDLTLDSHDFTIRIDLETGAIRSLIPRASGREWARGGGINAAAGFRLDSLSKFTNQGLGTRIVVGRRSPEGTLLKSAVTAYEGMPWIDIVNEIGREGAAAPLPAADAPVTYRFNFAVEKPRVSWEIPAGFDERPAPVNRLVHLRWLRLATGSDQVLFRGLDAPVASVGADSEVVSVAPAARARYRLGFASGFSAPEDPWRFGWGTEPLLAAPIPGTGRATLPSFGSMLLVDQAGGCIVEMRPVGDEVLFYLQELIGVARDITVGPGVLSFRAARRVDFTGRDLGDLATLGGGGVAVPIAAFGVTAVRLTGVELAAK